MNTSRLALYYAAYFAVIGILLPFWPVWLEAKGLDAIEIGFVLSSATFVRASASPFIAQVADRRGLRQPIMLALASASMISFAGFNFISGFWAITMCTILFFMFFSASQPLAESLTMHIVRTEGANYGRIRLWGSITFIFAAVFGGRILEGRSVDAIFFLALAGLGLLLAACLVQPRTRFPSDTVREFPIMQLLKKKHFLLLLAATAFVQSSHAVVYSFSTIHWKGINFSETLIGFLWAEGVVAEILIFQYSAIILRSISPIMLIVFGGIAGIIRWSIMGYTDVLPALILAQALHGFTFGATHLGAIHYISETIPPNLSATAQSLLSAVVMGIAIGITTMVSGALYDAIGSHAYFAMTGMATVGLLLGLVLYYQVKPEKSHV